MTDFAKFRRQVDEVHKAATTVIESRNARVRWQKLKEQDKGEEGKCIGFEHPSVLWDVPLRKTSVESRIKRAIVMDGHFYFTGDVFYRGGVNLEVYETRRQSDGMVNMNLLDTMHFDFEYNAMQTAYHPMFHVQFGKVKRFDEDFIKKTVCELGSIEHEKMNLDRGLNTPMRDVRIPTPQMDYMSVLAMVIADYFCEGRSPAAVRNGFVKLLRQVMNASNPARSSRQSHSLEQRWTQCTRGPFCASHWYEESHR
ncbi:hypothetical protein [Stenotrophomonas sp. 1337]|uniref:hypothetical protein n=1 Tax=Stenotrophomonas sp. 1337 TaxID=2817757 RepID=UPI002858750E|nr:hypothetical protein [Stenotrophomonas sp. 1337]MDR6696272.1 hypothetical protein [Stenotrophomonas sp. 1337]